MCPVGISGPDSAQLGTYFLLTPGLWGFNGSLLSNSSQDVQKVQSLHSRAWHEVCLALCDWTQLQKWTAASLQHPPGCRKAQKVLSLVCFQTGKTQLERRARIQWSARTRTHASTRTRTRTHPHTYTHTHKHTHTHTHTHLHTHTHTHTLSCMSGML